MTSTALVGIVTFNRNAKLKQTLSECQRRGFQNIVVLDNGSTDGTREYLRDQPGLHTIFSDKNEGGSGGFNRLMRYFIEHTACPWLLMFDDDAFPAFSCQELDDYLRSSKQESEGGPPAYALRVTFPDGTLCRMNRPGIDVLRRNPLRHLVNDFHIDEDTESRGVDFAGFVGLLIKRETIQKIGLVSKEFFIYSDDTYYTLSISRQIGKLQYCPELVVIHDCKRSSVNMTHHDNSRMERDVLNKIVLIREYSSFRTLYIALYIARLIVNNPARSGRILSAARKGIAANLAIYRNEAL